MRRPAATCRTKEDRRKTAVKLTEARAQRSPQEQLKLLDARFGTGQGATKERARLASIIEGANNPTKKEKAPKTRAQRRKAKALKYAKKEKGE